MGGKKEIYQYIRFFQVLSRSSSIACVLMNFSHEMFGLSLIGYWRMRQMMWGIGNVSSCCSEHCWASSAKQCAVSCLNRTSLYASCLLWRTRSKLAKTKRFLFWLNNNNNDDDFSCRPLIPVIKFCIIIICKMLMTVIGVVSLYWLNWSLYATGCRILVFLMVDWRGRLNTTNPLSPTAPLKRIMSLTGPKLQWLTESQSVLPDGSRRPYTSERKDNRPWTVMRAATNWATHTTAFLTWHLPVMSRIGRTEYQFLLTKASDRGRNVKFFR